MKKLVLYIHTNKIAGIDCSLDEMIKEMEIVDFSVEDLTKEEREEFEI